MLKLTLVKGVGEGEVTQPHCLYRITVVFEMKLVLGIEVVTILTYSAKIRITI